MNSANVDFSEFASGHVCKNHWILEDFTIMAKIQSLKNIQKTHHVRLAKEDPAQRRARRTVGSALLTSLPHFAKRLIAKYNSKDPGGFHELGISFLTTRYCRRDILIFAYVTIQCRQSWNSNLIKQWHRYGVGWCCEPRFCFLELYALPVKSRIV